MDELGSFERQGDSVDLGYERRDPRSIETVWAAGPARLGDWIGPARVEPHQGGRDEVFIDRPRPMTGRILSWEPSRLLEFRWDTGDALVTVVRCALKPEGEGTRLVFIHKGMGFACIGLVPPGSARPSGTARELARRQAAALQHAALARVTLQAVYREPYKLDGVMLDDDSAKEFTQAHARGRRY